VFIDDNPVERARVREALPGVLVPEWPADKRLYPSALRSLDCFDTLAISEEDRHRPEMYVTERRRAALKVEVGSLETWLRSLSMTVTVESLSDANVVRVVQLINKTNQFNLTTRRVTESELLAWVSEPGRGLWIFRVSDRFGDSGLTGIASVEAEGPRGRIEDFVLSCRVMGRKVEETMLGVAAEWARRAGLVELRAVYRPTAKNKPCLEFFQRSGFRSPAEHVFTWDLAVQYPSCSEIHLVDRTAESTRGLAVGSR